MIGRLGEKERELLRKEVFLVDQRRQDTELRLKALQERHTRFLAAEARNFTRLVKREREDDDEGEPSKKARLSSLVALPGGGAQEVVREDEEDKPIERGQPRPRRILKIADTKRDRKLMGFVLGHLNKCKQEALGPTKADAFTEKMRRVDQRLAEAKDQERANAKTQMEEDIRKQEELQARLTRRYEQLRKAHSRLLLEEREFLFSHFLETKTQPKLFFLPAHHTPATKKRLEERKSASATKYQEFRKPLDALILDVEQNSIEKILPSVPRGLGKGGAGRPGGIGYQRPSAAGGEAAAPAPGRPTRRQERDRDEVDELRERVQREDHRGGAREEEEEDVKPPLGLRRHAEDSRQSHPGGDDHADDVEVVDGPAEHAGEDEPMEDRSPADGGRGPDGAEAEEPDAEPTDAAAGEPGPPAEEEGPAGEEGAAPHSPEDDPNDGPAPEAVAPGEAEGDAAEGERGEFPDPLPPQGGDRDDHEGPAAEEDPIAEDRPTEEPQQAPPVAEIKEEAAPEP
eukprot:EG_transcript_8122